MAGVKDSDAERVEEEKRRRCGGGHAHTLSPVAMSGNGANGKIKSACVKTRIELL